MSQSTWSVRYESIRGNSFVIGGHILQQKSAALGAVPASTLFHTGDERCPADSQLTFEVAHTGLQVRQQAR